MPDHEDGLFEAEEARLNRLFVDVEDEIPESVEPYVIKAHEMPA